MHEVVNPFDLSVIGSVATHDWEAVDAVPFSRGDLELDGGSGGPSVPLGDVAP